MDVKRTVGVGVARYLCRLCDVRRVIRRTRPVNRCANAAAPIMSPGYLVASVRSKSSTRLASQSLPVSGHRRRSFEAGSRPYSAHNLFEGGRRRTRWDHAGPESALLVRRLSTSDAASTPPSRHDDSRRYIRALLFLKS